MIDISATDTNTPIEATTSTEAETATGDSTESKTEKKPAAKKAPAKKAESADAPEAKTTEAKATEAPAKAETAPKAEAAAKPATPAAAAASAEKPAAPAAPAIPEFTVDELLNCTARFTHKAWYLFYNNQKDMTFIRQTPVRATLEARTTTGAEELHKTLAELGVQEISRQDKVISLTATFETIQKVIKHPQSYMLDAIRLD